MSMVKSHLKKYRLRICDKYLNEYRDKFGKLLYQISNLDYPGGGA